MISLAKVGARKRNPAYDREGKNKVFAKLHL